MEEARYWAVEEAVVVRSVPVAESARESRLAIPIPNGVHDASIVPVRQDDTGYVFARVPINDYDVRSGRRPPGKFFDAMDVKVRVNG
jgi:hypothetical protein